jgi:hypothetical protein
MILVFVSYLFSLSGSKLYEYGLEYQKLKNGLKYDKFKVGVFGGYVAGVNESFGILAYCVPKDIKGIEIMDIVFQYLDKHPEQRNKLASILVVNALKAVFPCNKNK